MSESGHYRRFAEEARHVRFRGQSGPADLGFGMPGNSQKRTSRRWRIQGPSAPWRIASEELAGALVKRLNLPVFG